MVMVTSSHLGRYHLFRSELGLQGGKLFGYQIGQPAKKDSGPARSPNVMVGDKTKTKQTKNSIVGPRSGPTSFSCQCFEPVLQIQGQVRQAGTERGLSEGGRNWKSAKGPSQKFTIIANQETDKKGIN